MAALSSALGPLVLLGEVMICVHMAMPAGSRLRRHGDCATQAWHGLAALLAGGVAEAFRVARA